MNELTYTFNPLDGDRPHTATPNLNDRIGEATFPNRREAVKYLKKTTGYFMEAKDWAMLGKLRPTE